MRKGLLLKLIGAFLFVIAVGAIVIWALVSQETSSAFNLYTTRSGQAWAQSQAPALAAYYTQNKGWQGVESLLQPEQNSAGMGGMMGAGNGQGRGQGNRWGANEPGMGMMADVRILLADARGTVIYDSAGELKNSLLSVTNLKAGAPVTVGDQTVGTLIIVPGGLVGTGTPGSEFLNSVNRSILTAVVIAGAIALILGSILAFQITAPLRQLKKAANAISNGDLTRRVDIQSGDEFGDLGHAFNQMAESLDKAETQRRHLIADVAHELRTPLAVIQANLEGMLDGVLPLDTDQVESVHEQTLLLNRLVGDLRLLSLAEAGELALERQPTDLGVLVHRAAEHVRPQAAQKNITIETEVEAGLPEISVDADRIEQVLTNLIANALRYTPAGKSVWIEVKTAGAPGEVELSVTDPGPGIAAEDLPYIFDRFYRADKSRARASGGSGLGLAIVKQLVEAHGGTVRADSPVFVGDDGQGFGTRMRILLGGA
jgi:two-component system, OmpR family, sensor kinase